MPTEARRKYAREWARRKRASDPTWNKPTPEQRRRAWLKYQYDLTPEQVEVMATNGCAICSTHLNLVVDHDHSTGRVRGILCHSCNVAIGHMKDDPELLRKAQEYLL